MKNISKCRLLNFLPRVLSVKSESFCIRCLASGLLCVYDKEILFNIR